MREFIEVYVEGMAALKLQYMIEEAFEVGLFLNEEEFILYGWTSDPKNRIMEMTKAQYFSLIQDKLKRCIENQFYNEVNAKFEEEDISSLLFGNPESTAKSLFHIQFKNANRLVKESIAEMWYVSSNTVSIGIDDIESKNFISQLSDLDEFSYLFSTFYDRIKAFQDGKLEEYYKENEFEIETESEPWFDSRIINSLVNRVYEMNFVDFSSYVQENS